MAQGEAMRNKTRRYMESRATGYYPYYKLQWWNPVMMAWQDIQRRYETPSDALAATIPPLGTGQARQVIEVLDRGHRIIYECNK